MFTNKEVFLKVRSDHRSDHLTFIYIRSSYMNYFIYFTKKYFCLVYDYAGKEDLSNCYWIPKGKLGATTHFLEIIKQQFFHSRLQNPNVFFFKLLNEWLWVHPKISFSSLAVENLMRFKVKNATLLRICLYFLILSSTEQN